MSADELSTEMSIEEEAALLAPVRKPRKATKRAAKRAAPRAASDEPATGETPPPPAKKARTKKAAPPAQITSEEALAMGVGAGLPTGSQVELLPLRLSPSRAKDFDQCPKLFYYKTIEKRSTPNTIQTTVGTLAHEALELIFDHPRGERTPENAVPYVRPAWDKIKDQEGYHHLVEQGSPAEEELLQTAEQMVRNYFSIENPNVFDPEGRELHLQAKLLGVTLHGFIDRFDKFTGSDGVTRYYVSDYKSIFTGEKLATPTGWTTMGDIQVGEQVFGPDGRPTTVLAKSQVKHLPCYRITFDDASSIVCDEEHRWQVRYGLSNRSGKAWGKIMRLETRELAELFDRRKYPITIANPEPLQLPAATLPLDPYVLGVWLGDGCTRTAEIATSDDDILEMTRLLAAAGETVRDVSDRFPDGADVDPLDSSKKRMIQCSRYGTRATCCPRHTAWSSLCHRCNPPGTYPDASPLVARLRHLGLLQNKHVPASYLRGSIEQRLALLQGLMDTDGSWNGTRKQCVFVNTNERLIKAVQELVVSLGWTYSQSIQYIPYKSKPGTCKAYSVMFTPFGMNPFRLPRKRDAVRIEGCAKAKRRAIKSIEQVDTVPTQCIAVDNDAHMFLAGKQLVPTCNTGKVPAERFLDDAFFAMKVYAALARAHLGVTPYELRLIYVKEPSPAAVKRLRVTDDLLDATERKMDALWKRIVRSAEKGEWATKTGPLCPWCYFQPICPAWNKDVAELEGDSFA